MEDLRRYKGRRSCLIAEQVTELRAQAAAGVPKTELAGQYGIHRDTVYRYPYTPWGILRVFQDQYMQRGDPMTAPTPKCVLDRSRPCNSCVADNPTVCPYPYLLGESQAA